MNNKMIWLGSVVVAGMIIGFGFLSSQNNAVVIPAGPSKYDDFAKCAASKDVTMYGAVWCAHCLNEKKAFGSAFQYIKYVECPDNIKLCTDKEVLGYPTWIDGAGKKYEGARGLSGVAKISGCVLPE
jgi:hypothetical protein